MMTPYNRHDLLWLSKAGREYALQNIESCIPSVDNKDLSDDEIRTLILGPPQIPAIVRRQEAAEKGFLQVGFSSATVIDGVRLRIGSKVPVNCIERHITPFDVIKFDVTKTEKRPLPIFEILKALLEAGNCYNIRVGCFGSAALQLATGLPYWRENSDLDIYLKNEGTRKDLDLFYRQLLKCEEQFGVTIDAEIEFPGRYGVKLKELFAPGKWVLGKGLYDVVLQKKSTEEEGSHKDTKTKGKNRR